jgi:hypothetical protein
VNEPDVWFGPGEADGGKVADLNPAGCERGPDGTAGKAGVVLDTAQAFFGSRKDDLIVPKQAYRALVEAVVNA